MKPLVSVVMSVYNGEKYLKRAIDSILNQTFENFEFIIINDGSVDKSLEIIKSYKDSRTVLIDQENKGLTKSLNIGIKKSKGKYIARQDVDDVSLPDRLKKQVDFLEKREDVVLLGCRAYEIVGKKKILSRFFKEEDLKDVVKKFNPFIHSSVMFRKDKFLEIGLYDESFKTSQDYDAWIRLSQIGNISMLDEPLVEYYVLNDSVTAKKRLTQCVTSFKIREKNKTISRFKNFLYAFYQYFSGYIPTWAVELKRSIKD